ncbi:MAG TPA: hypothetical protein VKT77_07210 [Chthonomonadaceae bacterium]|nr:hypothetical protein [Chthonomonadaceae bacterium]
MQSPTVYSSVVTPRSRRLRTVGVVLLAAVLALTLYGYFGLMPAIERTLRRNPEVAASTPRLSPALDAASPAAARAHRVRKLQIAIALAYWGVCSLLLVGAIVVAWLDFREITRTYVENRRAIWADSTGPPSTDDAD